MERYAMLGKAVEKIHGLPHDFLGSLWDLIEKLAGDNGGKWLEELNHFRRKEPTWVNRLFEYVRGDGLPAIESFHFNDYIRGGKIGEVRVVFGDNLTKVFGGRVERDIPAETLVVQNLT